MYLNPSSNFYTLHFVHIATSTNNLLEPL